jgi:hypothetical protein
MWADMEPDCYGGNTGDQIRPRWNTYADGDKEGGYEDLLTLDPATFPPGTKLVISIPGCPNCGEPWFPDPIRYEAGGPLYHGKCDCGFDWDAWVLEQYS